MKIDPTTGGPASVQEFAWDHFDEEEKAKLLEIDPTLIGGRLEVMFKSLGFPPCQGCSKRKAWLNKAHAWLRGTTEPTSDRPTR